MNHLPGREFAASAKAPSLRRRLLRFGRRGQRPILAVVLLYLLLPLAIASAPLQAASSKDREGNTQPRSKVGSSPPSTERVPVLFIPGISGSKLREVESGKVLWGRGANLLRPHDGGEPLALTIPEGSNRGPAIEAFEVLDRLSVFGIDQPVYGPLLDALVEAGYRMGDPRQPAAESTLFPFAYDWRYSNVQVAQRLLEALYRIRTARGEEVLEVDLICQSNGGHICRYLAKYGGANLEQAEEGLEALGPGHQPSSRDAAAPADLTASPAPADLAGSPASRASPHNWLRIRKIVFVATANGGALRILRELHRGRTYVPWIGRWIRPEVLFTFPSLYQDLPIYRQDHILDAQGQPVDAEVFDPETWLRYGWSIFGAKAKRRVQRSRHSNRWGTEAQRQLFLTRCLDEARRFHRLLAHDPPNYQAPAIYSIQNAYTKTPERALLLAPRKTEQPWQLLFIGDRAVKRKHRHLEAHLSSPGDEHATLQSQAWFSPQEKAAVAAETFYLDGGHFEMVLNPVLHQQVLSYLASSSSSPISID